MPQLAPSDLIVSLRRPTTIFTNSYLNDPIFFPADPRFDPISAIRQLDAYIILPRDLAQFAIVELNQATNQFYSTTMYSRTVPRENFTRIIDRRIKQLPFVNPPNI